MTNVVSTTFEPLVRKFEGFGPLSDGAKTALRGIKAKLLNVPAGTALIRENDIPKDVFLILTGIACRYKLEPNGLRGIMAYLLPGDFCDLDVVPLSHMDHSIGTLSPCQVARMAPDTFQDLMRYPALARARQLTTLADEGTAREWLINIGRRSSTKRLGHLFCELHARLQVVELVSEDSYALPLTQSDLADTMGLSTVHVNRSLRELRQQKLIAQASRRVTILDLPRLQALASFRSNYLHLGIQAAA